MMQKIFNKLIYMTSLCLLVSLLQSCGKKNHRIIDPSFNTYITSFHNDALKYGKDFRSWSIKVQFGNAMGHNGYCYAEDKTVMIDVNEWDRLTEVERIILIYHELGHCFMGLKHNNNNNSIMNTYITNNVIYMFQSYRNDTLYNFFIRGL